MKNIFTLLLVLGTVSVSAQNLSDSIIAEYLLNNNLEDKSPNGFDLTNVNGIFVTDRNGQDSGAVYLNGSNAFLGLANESAFYAPEFSYSAWIKIDGMPPNGTTKAIISTGGSIKDNGISLSNNYLGQYHGLGVWTYLSGTQTTASVLMPSYTDTGWHHVMSTCNDDSIKMYLDGILIGSDYTGDIAGYTGAGNGFYIGCRTASSHFFKGTVDDVRIWSRALDAGEVVQVYNGMFTSTKTVAGNDLKLIVYPNPGNGAVTLERFENSELLTVMVFNSIGQVVTTKQFEESTLNFTIDTPGIYYIQVSNLKGVTYVTEKIIIH